MIMTVANLLTSVSVSRHRIQLYSVKYKLLSNNLFDNIDQYIKNCIVDSLFVYTYVDPTGIGHSRGYFIS